MAQRVPVEPEPIARREIVALLAATFVAFPMAIVALAGPAFLARPFWADEVLTWLLASDPSLPHALAALAGGVDTNAPLVHVGLHLIGRVTGHSTLAYRCIAMLVTGGGIAGLYVLLRSRCRPRPAVVGCLAFASMPIVIGHAAEARFYGLLVAASIWTAVAFERRRARPTIANAVGLAVASATLCGSHYFGVLALVCLAIGEAIAGPRRLLDRLYPSLAGLATLASCWPLLASQRAAARAIGGTWVPDTFWTNVGHTLPDLFPVATVVGLISVLVLRRLRSSDAERDATRDATWRSLPLLGLLLYPLAIVAFDRLVQPVIVPRYLMPMLPAVAALVAVGCASMRMRELRAIAAVFAILFCGELMRLRLAMLAPTARSAVAIVASVDRAGDDATIVTDWRGYAMPIYAARPALRSRLRIVDDPTLADPDLARSIPYERGMTRIMQSFYGWPVTIPPGELPTTRYALVTEFPERIDARGNVRIGPLTFVIQPTVTRVDRAAAD